MPPPKESRSVELFPSHQFLRLISSNSGLTKYTGESSWWNALFIPRDNHRMNAATEAPFINVFFPMPLENYADFP